jgi:selenocysteine-specific elongation factor
VTGELRVIATAGHVDHGKSSLIVRLTGIDPDRWAEEKRRGLTIDLGYAWCTLPSGREVGFVDVPGHERFVRNMLAGVGPVRLVLFVVAADEGWKPQSEEHLQILDVLGVAGGVIALTKRDLVDEETLAIAHDEVRERIARTALDGAPIVAVSSHTGEGLPALVEALDRAVSDAPPPEDARTRLFVDRIFAIKGAGTVTTGTLTGSCLHVGAEVELVPSGRRARIRGLQTHKEQEEEACPVSRVAANLVGVERDRIERGDVLAVPDAWRPTTTFDGTIRPIRGLPRGIPARGAFMVHAGAAETEAKVRFLDGPAGERFVRIRTAKPLVLDVFDRYVLREVGRRITVGGGEVLDVAPPTRAADPRHLSFLARRAATGRAGLPALLVEERGVVRADDVALLTGGPPVPAVAGWAVSPAVHDAASVSVETFLSAYHREHPLEEGAPLAATRDTIRDAARALAVRGPREIADALLELLAADGLVERTGSAVRLRSHEVRLEPRAGDVERLVAAVSGPNEARPPTVKELLAAGFGRELLDAAGRAGAVVRIAPDLIVAPALVSRAIALVHDHAGEGLTVAVLRGSLGTSRKYAVPLAEYLDRQGVTRREGDLRFPRDAAG